jgi:hypothetical protein
LGAGLVGAALGAAATLLAIIPQLRQAKREAAAAYQEALAGALLDMAAAFRAGQVPHRAGHTCEVLLNEYERYLRPYLGEESARTMEKLRELARQARSRDQELADELANREDLMNLAINLERVAGELQGHAQQIRVAGHKLSRSPGRA